MLDNLLIIACIIISSLIITLGIMRWAEAPTRKSKEAEPDPLKELESAHQIEIQEWDLQMQACCDRPIRYLLDPNLAEREAAQARLQERSLQHILSPGLYAALSEQQQQYLLQQMHQPEQQQQLQQHMLGSGIQNNPFASLLGGLYGSKH